MGFTELDGRENNSYNLNHMDMGKWSEQENSISILAWMPMADVSISG